MTAQRGSTGFACRAVAALLLLAAPAAAQAPAPAPSPTPEPEASKIDVTGFVDVYYGYNFNKVDQTVARTFDIQHNTFSLSLAEIAFAKGVTPESRVGFRVDLDFGKTANIVASFEPAADGTDIFQNIEQAYGSVLTGKVQWDVGKFVTPLGAEVIESGDNWNYSRSILFGYAIPFYHVGVRGTVTVNDKVTLAGYLVNGWNNDSEINENKTFIVSATLKPTSKLTWFLNDIVGKDTPGSNETRNVFDTTLTLTATPKLSLQANFDYGTEGDTSWWGIASYAKYQARPSWAVVGRYEYTDDTDGGFMTFGTKVQSLTLSSDHLVYGGLKLRLEYRTDFADEAIFPKDDGSFKDSQTTLTVGLVYGFGGKI